MDDLRSMVSNAHARGIYVILDIVTNHKGNRIGSSNPAWNTTFNINGYPIQWNNNNQYPPPFNQLTNFHNNGAIQNFVDPNQILGELSGLDDLRTETEHVRTNMVNIYKYWIEQGGFDGFRIDTVKHVEMGFWKFFNPAIREYAASIGKSNFFQFGEVYDGSDQKCGSYTGTQTAGGYANDSVLDFPLYFQVNNVFARATGNTRWIENRYGNLFYYHPDARDRLVTFLDNHDFPRFMNSNNANNNTGRLHVATSFLYSSRGIPCLYYGTEQNFNGGTDPNNREDMFDGQWPSTGPSVGDKFNMVEPTFRHIATLNNFRRLYPALRRGQHVNSWATDGPGLFAYARQLNSQEVFVVFNTSSVSQNLGARPTIYPAGTRLINLFDTNEIITVVAGANGIPAMSVPGTSTKMFIGEHFWQPLDPVVVAQSPVHAATNVNSQASIVLTFSDAMDTNSVQAAFSISPPAAGTFSWSGDRRIMTFSPNGGYAGLTKHMIKVDTNAAASASGKHIYGGFETFFVAATSTFVDVTSPMLVVTSPVAGSVVSNTILLSGAASDNIAVQRVEFRLDGNDWITITGTTNWSHNLNTAFALNGSQTLSFRAFDTSGNMSTESNVVVRFFNIPGDYVQRVSAGNPNSATNCDATVWSADRAYSAGSFGYIGGTAGNIANPVTGVCAGAQSLYQRERYSTGGEPFRYLFDCPPGIYETTLLEAEMWVTAANQRLFHVVIENDVVWTNLDIFAMAGGMNLPLQLVFTNEVNDSQLEIQFNPNIENARASGIQVRKVADVDSTGDGIPDWWMLGYFDHLTGLEEDASRPEDDYDSDGVSNRDEYIAGTSPVDDQSFLRIEGAELESQTDIYFMTRPGRTYQVFYSDAFPETQWHTLGDPVDGDGSLHHVMDDEDATSRVYRLGVWLVP